MAHAPTTSSDSFIDLNLGSVPDIEDAEVYQALLDIHYALEILSTSVSDTSSGDVSALLAYIAARTNITPIIADYLIASTDGTIKIDASAVQVTATLPTAVGITGTRYELKCIDATFGAFVATFGIEPIDDSSLDFRLYQWENLTVQSDGVGWIVL